MRASPPMIRRSMLTEEGYMDDEFEALQRMRKEEIEKLERDLKLMEAQQKTMAENPRRLARPPAATGLQAGQ
jgi:hypothetical protein